MGKFFTNIKEVDETMNVLGSCYFNCKKRDVLENYYSGQPTFMQILERGNMFIAHRKCFAEKVGSKERFRNKFVIGIENGFPTARLEINFSM